MTAWHDEARRLALQGLTCAQIAEQVHASSSGVWAALNPEKHRASVRPWKKSERGRKMQRQWLKRHDHAVCPRCGSRRSRPARICSTCYEDDRRARYAEALHLRAQGLTYPQIGARLGLSEQGAQARVARALGRRS